MPKLDQDETPCYESDNGFSGIDDQLKYALYDCERVARQLREEQGTLVDKIGELQSAIQDLTEEVGFDKLRTDIIALTSAVQEMADQQPTADHFEGLTTAIQQLTERLGDPVEAPVEAPEPAPVAIRRPLQGVKLATRRGKRT